MAVQTYTKSGGKAPTPVKLDKNVFGLTTVSPELLKVNYLAYLANGRDNLAKTKLRGEVRGGGRKPWRQKGTGRARFGSSRNPIWRGGGIVFGPTGNENYSIKQSTTAKRAALRQALSLAAKQDQIAIIEAFESKDGKVKSTVDLLNKIGANGNTLIVVSNKDAMIERATNNVPKTMVVQTKYLNVYDVMNADTILIDKPSLEVITQWLGGAK